MKNWIITTIAAFTILASAGFDGVSFGESMGVGEEGSSFSVNVNCRTIKQSYNFMEIYRANKAAHPDWNEERLQYATERVLSLLIAAMNVCDGKSRLHVVRSGILEQ